MPRRLRNLPSLFDTRILPTLSAQTRALLEEAAKKAQSVLESLDPGIHVPADEVPFASGRIANMDPRQATEGEFSEREPLLGREPTQTSSDVSFQKPSRPGEAELAATLPDVLDASEAVRVKIPPVPAFGQPPPHLVDRVHPTRQRIASSRTGMADVQKLFDQEVAEDLGDAPSRTWMDINEHDMKFREWKAREQAKLKAASPIDYDMANGQGAWKRAWNATLVRPEYFRGIGRKQPRPQRTEDLLFENLDNQIPEGGMYGAVEVPEGRGFMLDPRSRADLDAEHVTTGPGLVLPHLGEVTDQIRRKTGTGEVEDRLPRGVPWDEEVEKAVRELEETARFDRSLLQPIWDYTHGALGRTDVRLDADGKVVTGEGAEAKADFLRFIAGIQDAARLASMGESAETPYRYQGEATDPEEARAQRAHDQAMATFEAQRGFAPGQQAQGFAERTKKIDLGNNYAQLAEDQAKELTSGQGFQGNQASAADRDEFSRGTLRTLDEKESNEVGQAPLLALRKKSGAVLDQTENLRKGLVDLAIVPRGTVGVGRVRFGELDPYETEVLKVIPFAKTMKKGYLEAVSRRLLLPTDTLVDAVAGELEFDLIQVRKPKGQIGQDLPVESWTRHPDEIEWWAGKKGEEAKERLQKHAPIRDLILSDPYGRFIKAHEAIGKQLLGVIYIRNKPVGVGLKDPRTLKYRFYRLTEDEASGLPTFRYEPGGRNKGQPYEGDPIAARYLEKANASHSLIQDSDQVETRFRQKGDRGWIDPKIKHPTVKEGPDGPVIEEAALVPAHNYEGLVPEPGIPGRLPDTVIGAQGRPLLEEELWATDPSFSRGLFGETATESEAVVPQPIKDPTIKGRDKTVYGKDGKPVMETMEQAIARVAARGAERDPRTLVPGLQLSPTPVRNSLARGITWRLAKSPAKYDKGYGRAKPTTQAWKVAEDPSAADLTVVFTHRIPNQVDRNKLMEYKRGKYGPRELVNPTADELRYILQHSLLNKIVVQVEEPTDLATSKNLWSRVHAVVNAVTDPRFGAPSSPLQKKGNPNWVEVNGQWVKKTGVTLPTTEGAPLRGGPAALAEGIEQERLGLLGRTYERGSTQAAVKMPHEMPVSRVPLSQEEIATRLAEEEISPAQGRPAPVPAAPPSTRPTFMDAVRKMQTARAEKVIREAFPGWSYGKKYLGIAGLAAGGTLAASAIPGQDEAEAAGGRAFRGTGAKIDAAKAAREAMLDPPSDYMPSWFQKFMTNTLNFFEPIYQTASASPKVSPEAEQSLRHTMQTQHGGIVGQAEMRYEPVRLMREKFDKVGQTDNLSFFLNKAQNLYAWDNAARQKDQLMRDAAMEARLGNKRKAKELREQVDVIDKQMADRTLTEFGGTKASEIAELHRLKAEVGAETYDSFRRGANVVYKAVQQMIDDLHANGQLTDEDWGELKAKGLNYIPNDSTLFAENADGTLRWTGGKHIKQFSQETQGVFGKAITQDKYTEAILADPLTSAARFITEGTAQIARTKMAQKAVDVFEPAGLARRVDPNKNPKNEQGWEFYTFMRGGEAVTYEMPKQVVDSLLAADQDFTNRFLQNLPGQEIMGVFRSIAEAGATTANFGWAALQGSMYDPAAAMVQIPSKDRRIARRMIPFFGGVLKNFVANMATANRGKASSPLRQEAAMNNILYAGSAADLADYSSIEGRDTSGRMGRAFRKGKIGAGTNELVRKGLNVVSNRFAKPLDEAVKMTAFDMLKQERAKGLNAFGDEEIQYLARTRGGSGDWNQRGLKDGWVRTLISFGRPTMLANETAIRAGYQQPKKLRNVLITMLATEAARRGLNSLAANELGQSQEELQKRYSAYDQDNTFIVMIPPSWAAQMNNGEGLEVGANGIERPFAVKIPIPPILRVWTSPLKGLARAYETGNPAHALVGGAVGTLDELLPGSVPLRYDDTRAGADAVTRRVLSVLPAPYRLPLEQVMNRQFFTGAPVVGSRVEALDPTAQYSTSTDPFYKDLGGATGQSPQRLQHLGRGMFPGGFQILPQLYNKLAPLPRDAMGNTIQPVERSPIEKLNSIPLLGEVTKRFTPQRYEEELSSAQDQFYGLSKQTKGSATSINDYNQGVTTEMPSRMTQYLAAINPDVQRLVRGLAEIDAAQKQTINDGTMTPREKRDQIKYLVDLRRESLREFLAVPEIQSVIGGQIPEQ